MLEDCNRNPWVIQKIVYPQHTDHAGVMWHGTYLNWLEEARIDALAKAGLDYEKVSVEGYEIPVIELKIKYIYPLMHGNKVLLKSWVKRGKGPRWIFETAFIQEESKTSAIASVDLVLIKKINFTVIRKAPVFVSNAFDTLQKGANQ